MTEDAFWIGLMFRLCGEFAGLPERHQRRWWCDGFEPESYLLNEMEPRITGRVWMCPGKDAHQNWEFTLFLPDRVASRDAVTWTTLLPAANVTNWMAFDTEKRKLELEPASARPDPM